MAIKIGFFAAVALLISILLVILTNLPTVFDLMAAAAWVVGAVWVGRKSTAWF